MASNIRATLFGGVIAVLLAAMIYRVVPYLEIHNVEVGDNAPGFELADDTGQGVNLSDFRGKYVLLNFWATWCPPCKAEIPDLAAVYAARGEGCLEILGIAEDSGSAQEVAAAAEELGINYPVLLDGADGAVGELFEVPAYPRTILVDAGGRVRGLFKGIVHRPALEEALAPLLAEAAPGCERPR
jgi:cytochrome c biogenesis protein CcmG/thiol:disulfide interchange protein DsbE